MNASVIKVLIVEDSPTMADLLQFIIESDPELRVIGRAENGEEALAWVKKEKPDVVTMDIIMPKMDGFEATRRIMQTMPIPIIIISAHFKADQVNKSFQAMQAGALEILEKPTDPDDPLFPSLAHAIIKSIKTLAGVKLITRRYGGNLSPVHPPRAPLVFRQGKTLVSSPAVPIEAIAIGASLGGPQALSTILTQLPSSFPVPIFIVQHISQGFTEGFVDWIRPHIRLPIQVARHQEKAKAGHVYIAPDGFHLEVAPEGETCLVDAAPEGGARPSVGRLFRSMAYAYGPQGVGVILTGMGRDGVEDLLLMKQKGAVTIAQDQESALVFGMPKEAILIGATQYVIPLQEMASTLSFLVNCTT